METKIVSADPATSIHPIQLIEIGSVSLPTPMARISTCGRLVVSTLQKVIETNPLQGIYRVCSPDRMRRGYSSALHLLKILISLPQHFVSRDWLQEYYFRGNATRFDNIVSLLRKILCPIGVAMPHNTCKSVVRYIANRLESGPGYQLATLPLIWIDVDEIELLVKQACLREIRNENAIPLWEQAYSLLSAGDYLPEEIYSDFSAKKRLEVSGHLRQSIHALARLYLDGSNRGKERALFILRSYWINHPMDEDAFCLLAKLLIQLQRYQEAREAYQLLQSSLESEPSSYAFQSVQQAFSITF